MLICNDQENLEIESAYLFLRNDEIVFNPTVLKR